MWRALKPWLPVALWMGVIFAASTDLGSYPHTSRLIGPLLRWLIPGITAETIDQVQLLVRKAAHFTEYAILALLALRAAGHSLRVAETHRYARAAGLALLVAAAYAVSDEVHQSLVSSRTGSPVDVLIDTAGAGTALAAAMLWRKWPAIRSARRQPE